MSQANFLADVAQRLEAAGIEFMVTGSYGSSYYGQPRATNDLDLVIDPTAEQLSKFVASLSQQYYVSAEAAREALARRSMFNIIDFGSGWKADLIIRKSRPFSDSEFQRRTIETLHGCRVPMASPEDVILSKLEWDKITSSERQLQDAIHVAMARWSVLDRDYLRKWATELGVTDTLEAMIEALHRATH